MNEIESGLPVPIGLSDSLPSKLRKLKIGDSLLIPTAEVKLTTRKAVIVASRRIKIKIITRTVEEGLRIWRVEQTKVEQHQPKSVAKESSEPIKTKFEGASNNPAMDNLLAKIAEKEALKPKEHHYHADKIEDGERDIDYSDEWKQ